MTPNGRLHTDHKQFFCQCLAEFLSLSEITTAFVEKFSEEFEDKIKSLGADRFYKWVYQRVDYYAHHPDAKKWQELTKIIRAKWLDDIDSIPLANRRVRIDERIKLYNLVDKRLRAGKEAGGAVDAFAMAKLTKEGSAILDSIEEETGQKITRSKSEITGEGGQPLIPGTMNVILQLPDFQKEALEAEKEKVQTDLPKK